MRPTSAVIGLLCALPVWSACGGAAPARSDPPASPAGYRVVSDAADGYRVAVPAGWQQLQLDAPDVSAAVARLLAQNPQLASEIGTNATALVRAGVHFFAVGPDGSDVNVVVRPAADVGPAGLDGLLPGLQAQLTTAGGTLLAHDDQSVAGVATLHLRLSLNLNGRAVMSDQYYLVARSRLFVVTVRAPQAVVAAITGSLRFAG
jgi:hypothetical protein